MKIGPMIQNPGRVLLHIFMVGLLRQVMDNKIVNVVNMNVVNVNVNVVNENVNVLMNNANVNEVKDSAILAGGKTQSVLSQVVEVNIGSKDHRDVDVTVDNENTNVVNVNDGNPEGRHNDEKTADVNNVREDVHDKPEKRDDIDSNLNFDFNFDSEYDAHECEVSDNYSELPFWVSQKGERGDMHEKPEKSDVLDDINSEGGHDDKKTVEMQVYKRPEKREGTSSSIITYYIRRSSTKTEASVRYVELPVINQFVHLVTPLSNPGSEKPDKRNVMTDINPEGRYDEGKMVEKQVHKQPEKRDMMVDINPKGKHVNEKTVEKPLYETPEWRDMMIDINPEGEYDKG
jgi:hypothetical protein